MTTFTYTRDIPDGPHNPSADQGPMKVNTNSTDDIIAENHYSFGVAEGGKHFYIQIPEDENPGGSTGAHELLLYNGLDGTYNLYFVPPATAVPAGAIQMTRNEAPVAATSGSSWIAGGMRLKWGVVTFAAGNSHLTGNVTFTPNFTNFFNITTSLRNANTADTTASNTLAISSPGVAGFSWVFNSSSGIGSTTYPGFYWFAIGN